MKSKTDASKLPLVAGTGLPVLDIVVPITTGPLTRAALTAAGRLSAGLLPLIRMVHTQIVPFPLQLESAPISPSVIRQQFTPLAEEFGAHLQICLARDVRESLRHILAKDSPILLATRRRWWQPRWWKSSEERLAEWLRKNGFTVVVNYVEENQEFVEKNNA